MADNRLNKTGLRYLLTKLNSFFAKQTDLTALSGRVDDIVSEGGEPNAIATVKVNGTALTPDANKAVDISVPQSSQDLSDGGSLATQTYVDNKVEQDGGKINVIKKNGTALTITDKTVDIPVPTQVSDLTDGDTVATKDYVAQNGGKIDKIKVNNTEQTIDSTDKSVNIVVPTKVSDITNDSGFQTADEVTSAINTAIGNSQHLKKSVVASLPATGEENILYLVPDDNGGANKDMYIWDGSAFVLIGNTETDLDGYWNETNLTALTTTEIDEVWDSVFNPTSGS